ncbi:hypothetical protein ACTPOK_04810 [Streptomyces inhibens]|uniref:hypothetical protein n=1 Tax=Streptomyces inhibens TaxID=2293571 RepID=UPI00402A7445
MTHRTPPNGGRRSRRARNGEEPMVPGAEFRSYYGKPIIKAPSWAARNIAGYFFLGGLAGAGSVLAAGAQLTGRTSLATSMKVSSLAAVSLSAATAAAAVLGPAVATYTEVLIGGAAATVAIGGGRYRAVAVAGGLALLAGSACTRFGIFAAGIASAQDPAFTVVPQRAARELSPPD